MVSAGLSAIVASTAGIESEVFVAALTIRNLDETVKSHLRIAAAREGVSMEEQARRILRDSLIRPSGRRLGLGSAMRDRFAGIEIELELPARTDLSRPTTFD